jgi:hypothetical protein
MSHGFFDYITYTETINCLQARAIQSEKVKRPYSLLIDLSSHIFDNVSRICKLGVCKLVQPALVW